MTEIQAVIFDLGGVILRTNDHTERNVLAARLGVSPAQLDEIVFHNPVAQQAECGLATQEEAWSEAARLLGRPVEEIPEMIRLFFAGDRVDFALVDFIRELRERCTTALLSNTWVVDLPEFLRKKRIPDVFDVVISSAQCGMQKPDARIFRLALESVHARPEEAIFVDDAAANTAGAAALGIHTVLFRSTEQTRREILALLDAQGATR